VVDLVGVQKYTQDHTYINHWVSPAPFEGSGDIAVDKSGNVYVTDIWNHRIQKFSSGGELLLIWGEYGFLPGQLREPKGIAIDENELVYVAEKFSSRIQIFNTDGTFVGTWGNYGSEDGEIRGANDIVFDENGQAYVADYDNNRIQKFTPDGQFIFSWNSNRSKAVRMYPGGVASDQAGHIYVLNLERIEKFNRDGSFINTWSLSGDESGNVPFALGIGADQNGQIYVSDARNNQIEKFTEDGAFLMTWGNEGSGDSQFDGPAGIALDIDGYIYVADMENHRIQKFTSEGIFVNAWGSEGSALGLLNFPSGVAIDSSGSVLVMDSGNERIQKFTSNGSLVDSWGIGGEVRRNFGWSYGITVDLQGYVYVANTNYNTIQVFDPSGGFVTAFGEYGANEGMFNFPQGITVSNNGDIIVADYDNYRIQVFSPAYPSSDLTSGRVQNGSFEEDPALSKWTYGGSLPVQQNRTAIHGSYSMMLGNIVPAVEQGRSDAWAYQTIYIDPTWARPMLSFRYNMNVNDIMDYSDFFVEIQDGVGRNHLATVLRDGYQPCVPNVAPPAGTDLGWRSVSYDLSTYKGQSIRLVFINRNLWPNSWGIWTYVDDVRVVDAGALPVYENPQEVFLPLLNNESCDTLPGLYKSQLLMRPQLLP